MKGPWHVPGELNMKVHFITFFLHNNPLRAGIVNRLIDYRWSSHPAYAYNRRHPKWLDKDLIFNQIHGEIFKGK